MRKKTQFIHGGVFGDKQVGAISVPIYQVSTHSPAQYHDYEFSQTGNPTRHALERLITELEEGKRGFAFASGIAATTAIFMLFNQGDHVLVTNHVYGDTFRSISKALNRYKIEATFIDTSYINEIEKNIQTNTKAIFLESPTNPLLKITDIAEVSRIAKVNGLLTIVNNTFATPYLQNPITLGADIVLHNATKYLDGHSDIVAGLAVVNDEKLGEDLHLVQNLTGSFLGSYDSWLLMRGMNTLGVRMEAHEENTKKIVNFLSENEVVKKLYYPGLENHPNHQIAKKQSYGFGRMVSFDVGSAEKASKILTSVKYFSLAESLGAVKSSISIPARISHVSIPEKRRAELGITDGLIRISVGLEDAEDLIEDLKQAFI